MERAQRGELYALEHMSRYDVIALFTCNIDNRWIYTASAGSMTCKVFR